MSDEPKIIPTDLGLAVADTLLKQVLINYTNYKGENSDRRIEPKQVVFGSNEFHKEPQWLLEAYDLDKQANRTFALKDIKSWKPLY